MNQPPSSLVVEAGLLPATSDCACLDAARYAVITAPEAISPAARERLRTLYGRYWKD